MNIREDGFAAEPFDALQPAARTASGYKPVPYTPGPRQAVVVSEHIPNATNMDIFQASRAFRNRTPQQPLPSREQVVAYLRAQGDDRAMFDEWDSVLKEARS